ncbi:MAG: glycosyltransferase family 2 protein [Verrucomicrobiota bacterium JB025]|nr:glycosyltransferase family 2 protein [Verrucomicrobiota bacterium JB025]
MPTTPDYRIIIPVFNPPPSLLHNLAELEQATPGALSKVLLIDDASTNGVPLQAAERFPQLTRVEGDGTLWWCGGMKRGMALALDAGVDVVCWLNHDCIPAHGTIERLVGIAAGEGFGAVSAWCRSTEARDYPVNPGFRNLKEIPVEELERNELVTVDGVNGNCVAINADAIRKVGLPNTDKHPHYGDGPYAYRLHKAGFRNAVCTPARAWLEREYDRCIDIKWRCSFWNESLANKLRYYFLSRKSKFHWSIKYHDIVEFRGYPAAPFAYALSMGKTFCEIVSGHRMGKSVPRENRLDAVCRQYEGRYPKQGLIDSLTRLENA